MRCHQGLQIVSSKDVDTVVFDLDGTLLAGDSTETWLRTLLVSAWWRLLPALLILPLALALIKFSRLRRHGASILLWIATVGYDEVSLMAKATEFAESFRRERTRLRWRQDGIDVLQQHLAAGHRVIVVTAAPACLAERLLMPWADRLCVIGSSLSRIAGGWVGGRHCRGLEKCRFLAERGFGNRWSYAYSDSDDDAPILAAADNAFIVNAKPAVLANLAASGLARVKRVTWS